VNTKYGQTFNDLVYLPTRVYAYLHAEMLSSNALSHASLSDVCLGDALCHDYALVQVVAADDAGCSLYWLRCALVVVLCGTVWYDRLP